MPEATADPRRGRAATNTGPGRLLVAVYGVFAISATARSAVQLTTQFDEAPLAYLLSLFAALVYVVATVSLARGGPVGLRVAWVAVLTELVGVLTVGTLTVVDPDAFPDATVWSVFGQGYGFVPLVLPFIGLAWLWRVSRHESRAGAQSEPDPRDEAARIGRGRRRPPRR